MAIGIDLYKMHEVFKCISRYIFSHFNDSKNVRKFHKAERYENRSKSRRRISATNDVRQERYCNCPKQIAIIKDLSEDDRVRYPGSRCHVSVNDT